MAEMMKVYTHPDCSYSDALKAELAGLEVDFEEIDLSKRPEEWKTLEELTGGERTTPVSVEGDVVTVGFRGIG